jgi:hypothetical protein
MPPRFAYWTILIDNKPTAFRAAKREELQPTFAQLKRTNADVTMKWFARGRLWDDPEQAQWAGRNANRPQEQRGRDWRPGGNHRDPRAQFDRRQTKHTGEAPPRKRDRPAPPRDAERRPAPRDASAPRPPHTGGKRPFARKPARAPWQRDRQPSAAHGRDRRPWKRNPDGGARETNPQPPGARTAWKTKRHHGGGHRPRKPGAPSDPRRRRRDDEPGNDDK